MVSYSLEERIGRLSVGGGGSWAGTGCGAEAGPETGGGALPGPPTLSKAFTPSTLKAEGYGENTFTFTTNHLARVNMFTKLHH